MIHRAPMRCRRHAFMLMHLMIAIALFSLFSVAAFKLISLSLRITADVGRLEDQRLRHNSALGRLREDVWSARNVQRVSASTLRIQTTEKGSIIWSTDSEGALVRTERSNGAYPLHQSWRETGAGMSFEVDGSTVIVSTPPRGDAGDRNLLLVSQIMLIAEAHR